MSVSAVAIETLLLVGDVSHSSSPDQFSIRVRHTDHRPHHCRPVLVLKTVVGVDAGLGLGSRITALQHDTMGARPQVRRLDFLELSSWFCRGWSSSTEDVIYTSITLFGCLV